MEVLVVEREKLVRDRVVVGLQQFPEFTVTSRLGYGAVEEVRHRDYHVVFVGVPELGNSEGMQILEMLRDTGKPIEIVVITQENHVKELAKQKARYNVSAVLTSPIDATEFFRLVARMRERRIETDTRPSAGVSGMSGINRR